MARKRIPAKNKLQEYTNNSDQANKSNEKFEIKIGLFHIKHINPSIKGIIAVSIILLFFLALKGC